jgi:hypothetical protein
VPCIDTDIENSAHRNAFDFSSLTFRWRQGGCSEVARCRPHHDKIPHVRPAGVGHSTASCVVTPLSQHRSGRMREKDRSVESQNLVNVAFEIDTPDMNWDSMNLVEKCVKSPEDRIAPVFPGAFDVYDDQPVSDAGFVDEVKGRSSFANEGTRHCRDHSPVDRCETPAAVAEDQMNMDRPLSHDAKQNCENVRDLLSSILAMTPPPSANKQADVVVLALDTPMSDYGLTYRERAIKNGRSRIPLLRSLPTTTEVT